MKDEPDFYIGWQDTAAPLFAKPVRRVVIGLFVLVPLLAVLLVWQQSGFPDGLFEYGQLTTLDGQLIREPVPFLRVPVRSAGRFGFERILLIGLGKHGADSTLYQWEQTHGSLADKTLKVRGTLIYYEGKAVLELTEQADALLAVLPARDQPASAPLLLGAVSLRGEITDPKCFLGVMKPGDGRPHRSCAVRCVAGGIPPLLYVTNDTGPRNGYILVGPNGEHINGQLLPFVGKDVQLRGHLEQADNWLILRVDMPVSVARLLLDSGREIALCH